MLWNILESWKGEVEVNDKKFTSISEARENCENNAVIISSIILHSDKENTTERKNLRSESILQALYKITVKQYMTKQSTSDFDFMKQWNGNVPMPLRTMIGTVEKETKGMLYMKLHGDITETQTQYCMRCGKQITNPVSQFFGMGPECGSHNYTNPFESDEELQMVIENYRRNYLQKITWEGWIIRSAIISKEEV